MPFRIPSEDPTVRLAVEGVPIRKLASDEPVLAAKLPVCTGSKPTDWLGNPILVLGNFRKVPPVELAIQLTDLNVLLLR